MKKLNKLGFILFAAIPFLASCNPNEANQILNEANTILAEHKDSINTCHDAVVLLSQKLSQPFTLTDGSEFVYDSVAKQMVIMKDDKIISSPKGYVERTDKIDYFKFVSKYTPNTEYSQYLKKSGIESDTLNVTTGFDAGYHKDIKNLNYNNYSGKKRNVILRTYSDYLRISAPNDTINHYNEATNVIINDAARFISNAGTNYAYLKAKKVALTFKADCQVDMFEIPTGYESKVTIEADSQAKVYGLINCKKSKCDTGTSYELEDAEIQTANELITASTTGTKNFFRIEKDIELSDTLKFNRAVCIDLNGYKITCNPPASAGQKSTLYEGIEIESDTVDKSLYLIDSQDHLDQRSGIILKNCTIAVIGSSGKSSNLVVNSGLINQTIDNAKYTCPAISIVGDVTGAKDMIANATIYGGEIVSTNNSENDNASGCIGVFGRGANCDLVYGTLYTNEFCIYGMDVGDYDLSNSNVVIDGGSLTSIDNTCIYLPLTTTLEINGGTLTGKSCLNMNSGTATIEDSTLIANGNHYDVSEMNYDGSVIFVPKDRKDKGNLVINVNNSTLTSKKAYILDATGETSSNTSVINFNSGTYNYYLENGISVFDSDKVTVKKAGTWTKRVK